MKLLRLSLLAALLVSIGPAAAISKIRPIRSLNAPQGAEILSDLICKCCKSYSYSYILVFFYVVAEQCNHDYKQYVHSAACISSKTAKLDENHPIVAIILLIVVAVWLAIL